MLTLPFGQARLKEYKSRGVKGSGSHAELDTRLHEAEQKYGLDLAQAAGSTDIASATPTKASGTSKRCPNSPTKDQTANLKKPQALESILYRHDEHHQATIQCLTTLNVLPFLHVPAEEDDQGSVLTAAMLPILKLCEVIAMHTKNMVRTNEVESSPTANLCKLQEAMLLDVNAIVLEHPKCLDEPIVAELFSMFTKDVAQVPASIRAADYVPLPSDEEVDIQAAIAESLQTQKQSRDAMLDDLQREMQAYYSAQTGEGRADMPTFEIAIAQIPQNGIRFADLARTLNIHLHDRDTLAEFQEELCKYARIDGSILYPATSVDPSLPSDKDVVAVVESVARGVLFEDIVKILRMQDLSKEKAAAFRNGILERKVVCYNREGRLVLPPKSPAKDILSTKPTLTPKGSGAPTMDPTKTDSTARKGKGKLNVLIPSPTFGKTATSTGEPLKEAEASPGEESSILSPTRFATSHHRLGPEVARVRDGILAHIRAWSAKFPEPSQGVWPKQFSVAEKKLLRAYVSSYLQANDMVGKANTIDAAVKDLLMKTDFPVAKAHHKAAVQ